MRSFEYRIESHHIDASLSESLEILRDINAISATEGWRLAHVVPTRSHLLYIIERPLPGGIDSHEW